MNNNEMLRKINKSEKDIVKVNEQLEHIANKKSFSEIVGNNYHLSEDYMYSITVLGDSISHGANCPQIYEQSWVNKVKKAILNYTNSNNWGFVSTVTEISNVVGTYKELLEITHNGSSQNNINTIGYNFIELRGTQYINLKLLKYKKIRKIGLEFKADSTGSVELYLDDVKIKDFDITSYTGTPYPVVFIDVEGELFSKIKIVNKSGINKFVGTYLFDDVLKPVVNNYSLSGARLYYTGDELLKRTFDSNLIFFALGHNDSFNLDNIDDKLNTCYKEWSKRKSKVIVMDFIWEKDKQSTSDKLKSFCDRVGGIFIQPFGEKVENAQEFIAKGYLSDTSHLSPFGSTVVANKVLNEIGILNDVEINSSLYEERNKLEMYDLISKSSDLVFNKTIVEKNKNIITISVDLKGDITNGKTIFTHIKAKKPWLNFIAYGQESESGIFTPFYVQVDEIGRFIAITGGKTYKSLLVDLKYII